LTTISFAGAERRTALPVRSRSGGNRMYRRAMRHSRRVRFLRVCVLLAIPAVLAAVTMQNYLPSIGGLRLPAEIGNMVIKGTKITMQQPRLTGFTTDSRAYEFIANSAAQDITKPDLVELQQIRAKVEMVDKSIVRMWADSGLYDMKTEMLTLDENIHLVSSTGYEARLSHAVVDTGKGTVVSETPVWVNLLDGELNAKGMEIADKGDVLHFTDVTMILQSGNQDTKAAQP